MTPPHPHALGRMQLPLHFLALFVAFNACVRLGLLAFNGDFSLLSPLVLLPILGIGLLFDLAAGVWWLAPMLLFVAVWPAGPWGQRSFAVGAGAYILVACLGLTFVAASEFVFWNEFASRFNFIAVDYLIYTREVIGNIRESYDLRPAFAGIAVVALLLAALHWGSLRHTFSAPTPTRRTRGLAAGLAIALPAASFGLVDGDYKEFTDDSQAIQLAGNGHYEFFSAFRRNEIDYAAFYRTIPEAQASQVLQHEFEHTHKTRFFAVPHMPIEREIAAAGPEKKLNVVLVSVESLSAEFMGSFGNAGGLTPNLDQLARESLFFSRLYATGVRTVRGLEAITLSIPPTPGNSIVKRPKNENLFTLGGVFKDRGYEPLYIYGGYGYFDNMSAFFGNNGYTVVDRTAIDSENIHHETIWGVSDEDLFSLALTQLDQRAAESKPFFAHIMTTSNHRPYTYPAGRVDIPSGTGREGAVKYTDWAIGDFISRARSRAWFENTVFVILADHTASGRGKTDLPIENFHIPLLIWSPKHISAGQVDTIASQIDVGPTLLGLLDFSYRSKFFGHDILRDGRNHQRALMANYQTVGYYENDRMIELRPVRRWRVVDPASGKVREPTADDAYYLDEAISYYAVASNAFRTGGLVKR